MAQIEEVRYYIENFMSETGVGQDGDYRAERDRKNFVMYVACEAELSLDLPLARRPLATAPSLDCQHRLASPRLEYDGATGPIIFELTAGPPYSEQAEVLSSS